MTEKANLKAAKGPEDWKKKSAKLWYKNGDARWTLHFTKTKPHADGAMPAVDLAIRHTGMKTGLANLVNNIRRLLFLARIQAV